MRRTRTLLILISLMPLALFAFQNCSGYQAASSASDSGSASSASACVGSSCALLPQNIQLQIANHDFISLKNPSTGTVYSWESSATQQFDVAGYCDDGGYPGNRIYVELDGSTGFSATATQVTCDADGRFRLLVQVPSNYDYTVHTLKVWMVGLDSNGNEIQNPISSNLSQIQVESF